MPGDPRKLNLKQPCMRKHWLRADVAEIAIEYGSVRFHCKVPLIVQVSVSLIWPQMQPLWVSKCRVQQTTIPCCLLTEAIGTIGHDQHLMSGIQLGKEDSSTRTRLPDELAAASPNMANIRRKHPGKKCTSEQ